MNEAIINYTRPTANQPTVPAEPLVNFSALVNAKYASFAWELDVYEIYANVASFLYWSAIQNIQRQGINTANVKVAEKNKEAFVESPKYVSERIQRSLAKVIRLTTRFNYDLRQHGYRLCLTRKTRKGRERPFQVERCPLHCPGDR